MGNTNWTNDPRLKEMSSDIAASRAEFKTTQWSKLEGVLGAGSENRRKAVSDLFKIYWKPIYAYVRTYFRTHQEESRDLTQDFFLWVLETDFLEKADRERGCFRGFLKTALRNFVSNTIRDGKRLKRGGGTAPLSLEFPNEVDWEPAAPETDPEEVLDQHWKEVVMDRAMAELKTVYGKGGKEHYYQAMQHFYFNNRSYEEIGELLNVTSKDVENYLAAARKKLGQLVADIVTQTVRTPRDLRNELEMLFGKGSGLP